MTLQIAIDLQYINMLIDFLRVKGNFIGVLRLPNIRIRRKKKKKPIKFPNVMTGVRNTMSTGVA